MRVLLLGGAGMLGSDLRYSAPAHVVVTAPSSQRVDIGDTRQLIRALDEELPQWVINAAAYTDVDRAEADVSSANAVNAEAPGLLAAECARRGIGIVHYSTDYVFAGDADQPYTEDSPVAPLNAYGRSKLAGERRVLESGAHAMVLRTQWLFGITGRSFPRTMWERARAGMATQVVSDQVGRPSYTVDVATATWKLIARGAAGIVHVANSGPAATRFDVAARVFAAAGSTELLRPCASSEFATATRRPAYSVLSTRRLEEELAVSLPSWEEALRRFLAVLASEPEA